MKKLSEILQVICISVLLFGSSNLVADDAAKEILHAEYHRDIGKDSVAEIMMTLKSEKGRTRVRTLTHSTIESEELRFQLIRFEEPKSIEGTTFLSREINTVDDDEQFLYLPAAGRARRIVSSQKAKSFVNSDYTFEDMQRRHYSKDRVTVKGTGTHLGRSCTIIRREPIDPESSQYGALEACIDPTIHVGLRASYFDQSGKEVKAFTVNELKQIEGLWTVIRSELKDLEEGSSTELVVQKIDYNVGLKESEFSSSKLKSRK